MRTTDEILRLKTDVVELKNNINEIRAGAALLKSDIKDINADMVVLGDDINEIKLDVGCIISNIHEMPDIATDIDLIKIDIEQIKRSTNLLLGGVIATAIIVGNVLIWFLFLK